MSVLMSKLGIVGRSKLFRKPVLVSFCLVVIISFYIWHCLYWIATAVDDAYITFRYARNLIDGLGLVYNAGEYVEGYSNFLWLLMVAAGMKLGFDPIIVAKILGAASGAGAILCSFWLFGIFTVKRWSLFALIAPALLAVNSYFCSWSVAGLETSFFAFLLILSLALFFREESKGHPISAYIFSLVCLTRPEGFAYFAVFIATDWILWFLSQRSRKKFQLIPTPHHKWFYGIVLVTVASLTVFRLVYFDSLLPNTFHAKVIVPFQEINFSYLMDYFTYPYGTLLVAFIISTIAAIRFTGRNVWLPIALLICNWFFILYSWLDWMWNYRFHMYTLPILLTVMGLGLFQLFQCSAKLPLFFRRVAITAGILTLACLVTYAHTNLNTKSKSDYGRRAAIQMKENAWGRTVWERIQGLMQKQLWITPGLGREAEYLLENSTEDSTVGMRDIGFPGYICNCRVFDMAMLIHREGKDLYAALAGKRGNIRKYASEDGLGLLDKYAPDYFLFPRDLHEVGEVGRLGQWTGVVEGYLKSNMKQVAELEYGDEGTIAYYERKSLERRPSISDLRRRYKEIVSKNEHYRFLRTRLIELNQEARLRE
jgi:hypothetical protein